MEHALMQISGVSVLRIVGVDAEGRPLVQVDGARASSPASVVWMKDVPDWSRCVGLRVLAAFPDGEEGSTVVLGLLDAPPDSEKTSRRPKEKRLRIEGEEEVVIECGKSKIVLRADGRIEIRGGHLVSRSSGPNKIKGATVHIN